MALAFENRDQSLSTMIAINRRLITYYAWRCEQALDAVRTLVAKQNEEQVIGLDITLARWDMGLRREIVSFAIRLQTCLR